MVHKTCGYVRWDLEDSMEASRPFSRLLQIQGMLKITLHITLSAPVLRIRNFFYFCVVFLFTLFKCGAGSNQRGFDDKKLKKFHIFCKKKLQYIFSKAWMKDFLDTLDARSRSIFGFGFATMLYNNAQVWGFSNRYLTSFKIRNKCEIHLRQQLGWVPSRQRLFNWRPFPAQLSAWCLLSNCR